MQPSCFWWLHEQSESEVHREPIKTSVVIFLYFTVKYVFTSTWKVTQNFTSADFTWSHRQLEAAQFDQSDVLVVVQEGESCRFTLLSAFSDNLIGPTCCEEINRNSLKGEHSLRLFKGWFHHFWKSTERFLQPARTCRPEPSVLFWTSNPEPKPDPDPRGRLHENKLDLFPSLTLLSNSSSHSWIFYLYYSSNTFCKCNMKSTITENRHVSLSLL